MSAGGQFNIYNKVGSVNVIVDIVGYYTDHNHDDRYYTKAEIDAMQPTAVSALTSESLALDGTNRVVTTLAVTPSVSGTLVVNSSVTTFESTDGQGVECSISTTAAFDGNYGQKWVSPGTDANVASQLSGTRAIAVTGGVEATVNLVCRQTGGGTANLFDAVLTGVFVAS